MNVSVCLESNKPCDVQLEILKNVKLPKPFCHYSGEFSIASMYTKIGMHLIFITGSRNWQKEMIDYMNDEKHS